MTRPSGSGTWPAGRACSRSRGIPAPVRSVAFSGDGHQIASASDDGTVIVWEADEIAGLKPITDGMTTGPEGIIERCPNSESEQYDLLDRLAEEFAARFRRGERPALKEYTDRYPELADDIRELFPAMVKVEQAEGVRQADEESRNPGPQDPPP